MNAIMCLDCGCGQMSELKPKEIAKKFGWTYVAKGKWRCPSCQNFQRTLEQGAVNEQKPKVLHN